LCFIFSRDAASTPPDRSENGPCLITCDSVPTELQIPDDSRDLGEKVVTLIRNQQPPPSHVTHRNHTQDPAFRDERDWAQFHNPKDMAMAISIEAGELLEQFLWKSPEQIEERLVSRRSEIEDEIADIAVYLVELADNLEIDLLGAMERKLEKNAEKYPVDKARGSNAKYNEL
jgi:dCTP diphosphatase